MNPISKMNEIVIPVYGNEGSLPQLINRLNELNDEISGGVSAIFVIDGSIDNSFESLKQLLVMSRFENQVIKLSRNFGAFNAIRIGISHSKCSNVVAMSADLQEPKELFIKFFEILSAGKVDIVFGYRTSRKDGKIRDLLSNVFWGVYRRVLFKQIPKGGIDVFGISRPVAKLISRVEDKNVSLIGMLLSIGFRQTFIGYERQVRDHGKSSWSLSKRIKYSFDSVYAFSNLPLLFIQLTGAIGTFLSICGSFILIYLRLTQEITLPGYTPLMVTITFSTSMLLLSLGILGSYVWRIYENSKGIPFAIIEEMLAIEPRNENKL